MKKRRIKTAAEQYAAKRRHEREAEGSVAGALAGSTIGSVAGPPGAVAGAVIGSVVGAAAGLLIDKNATDREALERELNAKDDANDGP